MTAIDAARRFIGERESHGKNRSVRIDALNSWMGVPMGSPYCATGICRCFWDVFLGNFPKFPITASSQMLKRHFRDKGLLSYDPQDLLKWKGAIGGWTNKDDPLHGHVFFIEKRKTTWWKPWNRNKVVAIVTIEFNTNAGGSRDGDGVYGRRRPVPIDGSHEIWFCDVSSYDGGQWWK